MALITVAAPVTTSPPAQILSREVFPVAESARDQSTLDLLTRRMQIHEKNAWMLRSLLQ